MIFLIMMDVGLPPVLTLAFPVVSPHIQGVPKKMLIPLFWNTLYIPVYAGLDHVGRHGLESLVQMISELWIRPVKIPDKVL